MIRSEQAAQQQESTPTEPTPELLDYFVRISPELERPDWLTPYADLLQRAIDGKLRAAVAAPPQHGKTELALRAFLWWAKYFPGRRHAYVTYSQERAYEVAADFKRLAEEAGFIVTGTLRRMRIDGHTTIKFTSVNGGLTGAPIDGVCVIDDPYANYEDARSTKVRRKVLSWWKTVARARRHEGTSFLVMATRWHPDDFTGYVTGELGWQYVNLKAIAEPAANDDFDEQGRIKSDPLHRRRGESLWPSKKPPEFFDEERKDAFEWASQYQGEPRPEGGKLFHPIGSVDEKGQPLGAVYYAELPKDGYRGAFGLDFAYTAKTHADWSILLEGIAVGPDLYIVDIVRRQVDEEGFVDTLKLKSEARPGWRFRWYYAGPEKGVAGFVKREGIKTLRALPAVTDKRVRALPVSRAWNRGRVHLPDPKAFPHIASALAEFLLVVYGFTGDGDAQDDDVDALAALFDQLMKKNPMNEALDRLAS